jgi:hypothetical protein
MMLRWSVRCCGLVGAWWLLVLNGAIPATASAQGYGYDPASTVGAYTAALNSHDVAAALALFDKNGSATDVAGRTYEGTEGLTQFLLDSGFGNPDARIATDHLRVVGNRALWTYACSCADGLTEVRMVVNQNKITVFYMNRQVGGSPGSASTRLAANPRTTPVAWVPLLLGLALGLAVAVVVLGVRRRRPPSLPTRPSQGSLLASLAQSRRLMHADTLATNTATPDVARTRPGASPWR